MWIKLYGLLCWWLIDLYAGRLQCKGVLKISITLMFRVHSLNPILGDFEGIFHVSIATYGKSHVVYYVGGLMAYILADLSENGCLKYQLIWCAGSIAMNPMLGDFEGIFHVSISVNAK